MICCRARPESVSSRLVLAYLSLHGFNCVHGLTGRKAQGRSASGRNGGARKTTSSNSVVMHIASNDFFLAYTQAVLSIRYFMTNAHQSYSCLRAIQFCSRLTGPHAASWGRGLFAIHVRVSSHCTHTYRSRWGRATCLSNWAQGLNMERLRAQAPWRSHTQTM